MKVVKNFREQGQTNPPKLSFVYYKYILTLSALSLYVCCCLFVLWVSFFIFYPVSASPSVS